jgi:hypothetical protein
MLVAAIELPAAEPFTLESAQATAHGKGSANQLMTRLSLDGRITPQQYEEACRRADDFERAFASRASGH